MSFPQASGTDARRHELLADVAERIAQRLIEKHAVEEDAACDVGNDLADFLADHWKGQTFYLPADQAYRLDQRDWDIFRRMERGNAPDLAREFGISKVRVHQVFKRCLTEYRRRTQNSLFAEESNSANQA
jgi:Mor family transcriptional regulator